jgi:integrase
MQNLSFDSALSQWLALHSFGRRPRTLEFNREIVAIIRARWPAPQQTAASVTIGELLAFSAGVAHYCASRWNAIVSALRHITPAARALPRRRLSMRQFTPPSQQQFADLLKECDADPRSRAGLVVRFLSLTGLRISEARALKWSDVSADSLSVPSAKGGRRRTVPLVDGAASVLDRLRAVAVGEGVLPAANPRKAIRSACRRAAVPSMSFHCFRHLFATRCIESGVDLPTVARWMGHRDGGALLARTYFHLVDEHSRTMARRVTISAGLAEAAA